MDESSSAAPAMRPESPVIDEKAELKADMEKYKDLAYRAAAELENYKRRVVKEREELSAAAKERFVSRLLPVVDAFELAAASVETDVPAEIQKKYLDGFQAIGRQLLSVLEGMGLGVIELSADAAFHPGEQEAVLTEEVPGLESPMVLQVLQKGYRLDGRLIRPVRVKVGMPKGQSEENERGDSP